MRVFQTVVASVAVAFTALPALANQTSIADVQRGTMVTVTGVVDRILDEDEFRLRDGTGALRVYVGPNWVPADIGEQVTVEGYMDNDIIFPELYARQLTRADGSVVEFSHRYE